MEALILNISDRGGDYSRAAINRGTVIIRGNTIRYFLEMSNCKSQSRAESVLQIETRRKERHSDFAVYKSSEAS